MPVSPTTASDFCNALSSSKTAALHAYILRRDTVTEKALIAAASAGSHVTVRLAAQPEFDPTGGMARMNAAEVARLRAFGIDAGLDTSNALHLKAAVVDDTAYFDNQNWNGGDDIVLQDTDANDVAQTLAAINGTYAAGDNASPGTGQTASSLRLTKLSALKEAAQLVTSDAASAQPHDTIEIATETLGPSPLTAAVLAAAAHGEVDVLVDSREYQSHASEQKAIAALTAAGVQVRETAMSAKFVVAGDRVWAGSANATPGDPKRLDWGALVDNAQLTANLRERFSQLWSHAHAPS